jgi:hypothetical protein
MEGITLFEDIGERLDAENVCTEERGRDRGLEKIQ